MSDVSATTTLKSSLSSSQASPGSGSTFCLTDRKLSLPEMPSKKFTTPTLVPGGGGQYSSSHPRLFGKYLKVEDLDMIFFAYNRYRHERRPLLREEVCGIIGVWFAKDPPQLSDVKTLLDAFVNPQHPLSEKHQRSTHGKVGALEKEVRTTFNTYLGQNEEANARAEYLRGSSQRLVIPNWQPVPRWNSVKIWPYKFFPLYVIANCCKMPDDSKMNQTNCLYAAAECFFGGIQSKCSPIMKTLAQENSPQAEDMAILIMADKGFFLRRTQEVLDEHMRDEAPRVDIPPEFRDSTVPSTTKALESFTLEVTAPNQPQPTVRTGYGPIARNPYQPITSNPYQPLSMDIVRGIVHRSYHYCGPGSSQLADPGPYQNTITESAKPERHVPANPGSILGSSRQSSGEDEDEEEGERAKEQGKERGKEKGKEREKGKKKDKRNRSETPGSHGPAKRRFDPVRDV